MRPLHNLGGLLVVCGASIFVSACVSGGTAPASLAPAACSVDARLPGKWKSKRLGDLGPGSMSLEFNCDCTYKALARVLTMFYREKGAYWVEGDGLHLTRATGETTVWPLAFRDDVLLLTEDEDETYEYQRKASRACPGT